MKQWRKQPQFELCWHHAEVEKSLQNKFGAMRLISPRKDRDMELTDRWTLEDLNKLKSNQGRPIGELVRIFKGRFLESEIRDMRSKIVIEEKGQKSSGMGRKSLLSEEEFRAIYDNRKRTVDQLAASHPELLKKMTRATLGWYLGETRAEVRGIRTRLSKRFYSLLKIWHEAATGQPLPPRGSAGVRATVYKKGDKNKIVNEVLDETLNSDYKATCDLEDARNISSEESAERSDSLGEELSVNSVSVKESPIYPITNTQPSFATKANVECCHGLLLGSQVKFVSHSPDFLDGVFAAYSEMGLGTICKKVRIKIEEY